MSVSKLNLRKMTAMAVLALGVSAIAFAAEPSSTGPKLVGNFSRRADSDPSIVARKSVGIKMSHEKIAVTGKDGKKHMQYRAYKKRTDQIPAAGKGANQ